MTRKSNIRFVALLIGLVLTVAACGQKAGVHAAGGGLVNPNDPGAPLLGPGGAVLPTAAASGGGGGTVPGGGGTVPGGGGTVPGGGGGAPPPTGPGDRTGITATDITIGVHAPLTGAAPIESRAFEIGKDLYWNYLQNDKHQTIYGRKVKVVFADDNYTPSTAVNVCDDMASSKHAFLLIGAAGTDQINACAQYSDQRGIPYLSPGVQEAGLSTRHTYFAVSMTYKQQMPVLVQLLKKEAAKHNLNKYGDAKVKIGHVRPNTPNFDDADDALKQAALAAGFDYRAYTVTKEGTPNEAQTVATQLQQDGVDIVIPITAPLFTIQLAINTGKNAYRPLYAGIGVTNQVNQMINNACKNNEFDNAIFLSPWPGWRNVMHYEFDKDFRAAADKYGPLVNKRDKGGDLLLALWGIMKTVHQMLLKAGPNVSRQSLVQTLQTFNASLKVFPDLQYSAQNHFGARNVHVLLGKCSQEGGDYGGGGAQWISHPDYPGLRSGF